VLSGRDLIGAGADHRNENNEKAGEIFEMTVTRRLLLSATLALATSVTGAGMMSRSAVAAEEYPARPVTMVVPVTPGGIVDFTARLIAEGLTSELGSHSSSTTEVAPAAISASSG
jgi:hypothetical protein